MKKIKCIAIDDEPLALLVISQFCERKGNIELTTYCEPKIGLEEIIRKKPDLVFLDIEMNSISGLDIAHILPHDTCFIFTTAHAQYALDGFDLNATDFLHKPFSYERFEKAIEKAFRQIKQPTVLVMAGKGSDQFIKYGKTYVPCASDGQVVAKLIREYDEKYR